MFQKPGNIYLINFTIKTISNLVYHLNFNKFKIN